MQLDDNDLKSIQEVRVLLRQAAEAQKIYAGFSQAQVDRVTEAVVRAGARAAEPLAQLAVEESGFGRVASKTIKNRFSSQILWEDIQSLKTVGVVSRDARKGVLEIAEPYGVIVGIIPITNPTSTTLFKGIISLKTRNAVVFSPHPRGVRCIGETTRIMAEAAQRAGAPPGLVSCMTQVSMDGIKEAMHHDLTSLILATGGTGLVKAAYSAGKPAYGVGPGNAPAFIERSANIHLAVKAIVASQTFDNSTVCASEQAVVIDAPIRDRVLREFYSQGAHWCSPEEIALLERVVTRGGGINPDIVGRYPHEIAKIAGFDLPQETTVILAEAQGVGDEHPLSIEKLSPILAVYSADGWEPCCEICLQLLQYGGMGHTMAIHSKNEEIIMKFALEKPVNRILINAPTSQGAVGYATGLVPSMTLGCGAHGGNITSDNVSARNLLLTKRVARVNPGFVEGCDVPLKGTARVSGPPPVVDEKEFHYRNEAFNAPPARPAVFNPEAAGTLKEKSTAEPVPERCPFGGGCGTCESDKTK